MSERREVWETLSHLLQRVEKSIATPSAADSPAMEQEIRKLGKTQHKANLLAEEQKALVEQTLAAARSAQEQNTDLLKALATQQTAADQKDIFMSILPALDGLEHAINSGQRYLHARDQAAGSANLTHQQAVLISPADRAMLAGWLSGLNLVRERLLAVLDSGSVTPIASIGEPFDPYQHVAVGVTQKIPPGIPTGAANTIVAEERRGYRGPSGVIRFAEVIVYRP
jgi:molecular chaperone GrpE (heat shock protein)